MAIKRNPREYWCRDCGTGFAIHRGDEHLVIAFCDNRTDGSTKAKAHATMVVDALNRDEQARSAPGHQ